MPNDRVLVMLDMVEDLLARIRGEMGALPMPEGMHLLHPSGTPLDTDNPDSAYMEDLTRAASTVTTKPVPTTETQPPAPTFTPRPDLLVPFAGGGRSPGGKPWSTNPDETDGEEASDVG